MDYLLAVAVIAVAILIPAFIPQRISGKRNRALSGILSSFDEVFHPSAKEAQLVVEEQSEAVKPMPSPEDKKL